jgi:hypothetical protein
MRGDALGGKAYAIGTVELTVPTFLPDQYGIKAALFSDVGTLGCWTRRTSCIRPASRTAWPHDPRSGRPDHADPDSPCPARATLHPDDLSLRASVGVSIFWKSPMGPIRFDFSRCSPRSPTTARNLPILHFNQVPIDMTFKTFVAAAAPRDRALGAHGGVRPGPGRRPPPPHHARRADHRHLRLLRPAGAGASTVGKAVAPACSRSASRSTPS